MSKIIRRIYIRGDLQIKSPLIIGSGEDKNTDIDMIKDWQGNPFIPGTSLAGVLKNHLCLILSDNKDLVKEFFGGEKEDSRISPVIFSDAVLKDDSPVIPSIRDNVKINHDTGTAEDKAKFNFEILEPGSVFDYKMEVIVREKNREKSDEISDVLYYLISSLENGKIRIGRKTNRGFGKVELGNVQILSLDMAKKDDAQKWLDFSWDGEILTVDKESTDLKKEKIKPNNKRKKITAEFSIPNSLIIRNYSSDPSSSDYVHLKCADKSVVSGTSWAGVIRHTLTDIGKSLGKNEKFEEMLDEMFGYAKEKKKKDNNGDFEDNSSGLPDQSDKKENAKASRFIIDESVISGGDVFPYTRNRIDRFTGGASDGALFTEEPHYGGKASLEILCPPDIKNYETGLILLALWDIGNGISPVGGESGIGRGILEGKGIKIDGSDIHFNDNKTYGKFMRALADKLNEGGVAK